MIERKQDHRAEQAGSSCPQMGNDRPQPSGGIEDTDQAELCALIFDNVEASVDYIGKDKATPIAVLSDVMAAADAIRAAGYRRLSAAPPTLDEGELAEALERAFNDCGQMAPTPPAGIVNILGRHMVHHLDDVRREFAEAEAQRNAELDAATALPATPDLLGGGEKEDGSSQEAAVACVSAAPPQSAVPSAANYPVIPDGWALVPRKPTPWMLASCAPLTQDASAADYALADEAMALLPPTEHPEAASIIADLARDYRIMVASAPYPDAPGDGVISSEHSTTPNPLQDKALGVISSSERTTHGGSDV